MLLVNHYQKFIIPLMFLSVPLLAGPFDSPAPRGDIRSAMYSIEDICQRLKSGQEGELKAFRGPPGGPQDLVKRCTLNDVMSSAPKKDETGGAQPPDVLSGKTYWGLREEQWGLQMGTMLNQGGQTYIPSTQDQKIAAGYHDGTGMIQGDEDLISENVKLGINLFGVSGSYNPQVSTGEVQASEVLEGKTFSSAQGTDLLGTMLNQGGRSYVPGAEDQVIESGYYDGTGLVSGEANLLSENIKGGVSLFGVLGEENVVDTSSGDALPDDLLIGKKAWVRGEELMGTLSSQSLSSNSTTVKAGVYEATTLKSVDSDLVSDNIRGGVTIFGILGDSNVVDTRSGTALSSEIVSGKTAWVAGEELEGTGQLSTAVAAVPKTGQTTSYESGDDGTHQQGVTTSPRFTEPDPADGTVLDNLTGLIWLKNANCFGAQIWSTALTSANGLSNGSCGLSDNSVAGDWRLPNLRELQSLVDYGEVSPALPSGHPFLNVQSDYYWSATTSANPASTAWGVNLYHGYVHNGYKTNTYYVWPVRGGQ